MKVIALTKNFVAVVSAQDYRRLNKHKWHVHHSRGTKKKPGQPYARATIKGKKTYMHRFVFGDLLLATLQVDHCNHCTLDNRRENLKMMPPIDNNRKRRNVKSR